MLALHLAAAGAAVFVAQPQPGAVAAELLAETGAPGAAVARRCPGDPFAEGVAGLRALGGEAQVEPGDLWHMGSNTKAMTATLAARLVEQGVIGWEDTIGSVLGDTGLEIHPDLAGARLDALLAHTSGIKANVGILGMLRLAGADADADYAADRRTYAEMVLSEAPAGARGDFLYSNAGYVVAGLMLETAADIPYEALMAREVFEPLGMESAGWGPPGVQGEADQPRGHAGGLFGRSAREPGARADNPPAVNSAGRVHISLEDLTDFLTAHAERPADYLSQESWTRLQTPPEGGDYALGWGVLEGGRLVHAGSNTMWFARMTVEPETGCVAAAAVNTGDIDAVSAPVNAALDRLLSD
ncbi:MAG: serine hydrolase domain-containing protein [Oceanicaulis sp.]